MEIVKRNFEAKKYPKNSEIRKELNNNFLTSEYMTSYKYGIVISENSYRTFRTKSEAEEFIKRFEFGIIKKEKH